MKRFMLSVILVVVVLASFGTLAYASNGEESTSKGSYSYICKKAVGCSVYKSGYKKDTVWVVGAGAVTSTTSTRVNFSRTGLGAVYVIKADFYTVKVK